jgi:hypothetical protein
MTGMALMAALKEGDVIQFANHPQRWKVVFGKESEGNIHAWKLVPIDEEGNELDPWSRSAYDELKPPLQP